jgi:O-antigen/teichoic acid export membrane protein
LNLLVIGYVLGFGVASAYYIKILGVYPSKLLNGTVALKSVAARYKRFAIYSAPAALTNSVSSQGLPLILAAAYGPMATGYYLIAHKVLAAPVSLIGAAVGQFLMGDSRTLKSNGTLAKVVLTTHGVLIAIGVPIFFFFFLFSEEFFVQVFGEDWEKSGSFAESLSPWLYMVFVASPISVITTIQEKLRFTFWFDLASLFLRLGTLLVATYSFPSSFAVQSYSLVSTLVIVIYLTFIFKFLSVPLHRWVRFHVVGLLIGGALFYLPNQVLTLQEVSFHFRLAAFVVPALAYYYFLGNKVLRLIK